MPSVGWRAAIWRCGFPVGEAWLSKPRVLVAAAYVENLYGVSRTVGGAALILKDASAWPAERWSPGIKAGSREMVVVNGADGGAPAGWTVAAQMSVLGVVLSSTE